jgi:hypothetical protein
VKYKNVVTTATWRPVFARSSPYILIPSWNKKLSRHSDLYLRIPGLMYWYRREVKNSVVTATWRQVFAHSLPYILILSWNKKGTDVTVDELYKWYVLRAMEYILGRAFYHNEVWRKSHSSISLSVHFLYSILLRTLTCVSERRRNGSTLRSFHRRNDLRYMPPRAIVTQERLDKINCGLS